MPLALHPLARATPRIRAELRAADPALTDAGLEVQNKLAHYTSVSAGVVCGRRRPS
mgnify:CR=1 FL=1